MPGLDLSRNIFDAGASAATDWGAVSAGANFAFTGDIQLHRGIDIDLGLAAFAQLDASFHRFLAANLTGNATAQATLEGQVQMPLNLFDEIGIAVRLQAVAELAAGARLALGLEIGDFLDLVDQDPQMRGMPAQLLRVLLEQVDISAGVYAKAAFSAEAYANVVITGTALNDPQRGLKPGFNISAGAGAGLSAGAGFEVLASIGIKSFPNLVARTADVLIDEVIGRIARSLPASEKNVGDVLQAARIPLKLAIRLTYELGAQLAKGVTHDQSGQDSIANRVVQVCLEELQRATLEGMLRAGMNEVQSLIDALSRSANVWSACRAERLALAARLDAAPDELFTIDAMSFWAEVAKAAAALGAKAANSIPGVVSSCAVLWCAAQLAEVVGSRATQAEGHVSVIGKPPLTFVPAFSGDMPDSPPGPIDQEIRNSLRAAGAPVSGAIRYQDVVLYLAQAAAVDLVSKHNQPLVSFLKSLLGPVAPDMVALVGLILKNGGSFALPGQNIDPAKALQVLATGIDQFVQQQLTAELRTSLDPYLRNQPDLRVMLDEVMMPSLNFALDVVFGEVAAWATSNIDSKSMTEALSAILLQLLGRSLVVTSDILLAHAQQNMSDLLNRAAQQAGQPGGLAAVFHNKPQVELPAEQIVELIEDALQAAAQVFGPVPDERRARIRNLLYAALDPLGGAPAQSLLQRLDDPAMVPNLPVLQSLAVELGTLASERFAAFVQSFISRIVTREVQQFQAALAAAIQTAGAWIAQLGQAVAAMERRLEELVAEIQQALAAAAQRIADITASLHHMLDGFGTSQGRQVFASHLVESVTSVALGLLDANWVYQNVVPGFLKAQVRSTLRSIVRTAVSNQIVDQVLSALGGLTQQIDDLVDDIRALDRGHALAPQIRNLILSRLTALVGARFGTVRIPIKFDVKWDVGILKGSATIDLGAVAINANVIQSDIRTAVSALQVFDPVVNALAASLQAFFAAEDQAADHATEKAGVEEEHEKALQHLGSVRSGPKSIEIERPVSMASLEGQVTVILRLNNFDKSILARDAETPPLLFILLNGAPVDVNSFVATETQASAGLPRLGPFLSSTVPGSQLRISTPPLAAVRLPQPLTPAPPQQLVLTGVLPVASVRKGLNTILVEAVAGANAAVQASCGFVHSGAAPQDAAPAPPPGLSRRDGKAAGLKKAPLPKADGLNLSPSQRAAATSQVKEGLARVPTHPFSRLAAVSPATASKLGIAAPRASTRRSIIRLADEPRHA
jgi:hypothetical protein